MAGKRKASGPSKRTPAKKSASKTPNGKKAPLTGKQRLKVVAKWGAIGALVMTVLAVTTFVILYKAIDIPNPDADFQTETTYVYYDDDKTELGRFATQDRNSIDLDEMPDSIKDAVVAAEDQSFWTNPGIDIKGILRAAFSNARGNATQGASTITQQYVKILYLTQEQSYKRKIKEAVISLKIKNQLSKDDILEGYLNTIYFGRGAYGIDAAAQAYFAKSASDLNLRESAALAAILNSPSTFDPANGKENRELLFGRYQYVLNGMADLDGEDPSGRPLGISSGEADQASQRLPKFPPIEGEETYAGQKGHALALIKDELLRLDFTEDQIDGGGLRVYTTLNKKVMDAAEAGVEAVRPPGLPKLHAAVASVEPGTGALRGFYGGQDYLKSQINWAVSGGQPGSTFKPFALAAGLDAGFSLKDRFPGNSPLVLADGTEIYNQGQGTGDQGAMIDLLRATEMSVNTAYVDLTVSLPNGAQDVVDMATNLGIPKWNKKITGINRLRNSPGLEPFPTVTLGSASISPINMANAYGTIADGGNRASFYVIEKVEDRNGEVLYRHRVNTEPVLDEDIAADVSYALQNVVEDGTGTAAQALGRPAAGKTGTATAGDDEHVSSSWFVGYTPQLATAVMYVRGSGTETLEGYLNPFFGGTFPAQTWTAVMRAALEGEPIEEFPPPANVDGEAPDEGHEPFTPKPSPTKTTETPTETPTTETPTETPTTETPTTSAPPNDPCDNPFPPQTCSPTVEPTEEEESGGPGNGNGRTDKPRVIGYREEYARLW